MKQLKVLTLIGCVLLIVNCKTTPSLQFQKINNKDLSLIKKNMIVATLIVESKSSVIKTENVDINEEQTAYIKMNEKNKIDEKTFVNLLNANFDKLALIEGIWSNEKNTYRIGIQETKGKGRYIAFILNSREPTMKKGEIIAEFFKTRYEHIYSTEYYLEDKIKIVTKSYIDEHGMLLIFLKKWGKENVAFFRNFPIKEATKEKEKVADLKQSLTKEGETGNDEYYVQVGSWKNSKYVKEIFIKIKKHYPNANLVMQNNVYKVRISGVMSKKQGTIISKDIEKKFNLKPILVLIKQ